MTAVATAGGAREAIDGHPLWYHTMELAPGAITPGWFDLRPIVDRLPWPDVSGKRCLEVGPYDGYLAFELERRGAAEVIAADIGDHAEWDWPVDMRGRAGELRALVGSEPGAGFAIAKTLLSSKVERIELSAYELSPERVGRFDVVVCGSLLLHLRDPVRALEAMGSVCSGSLLSAETIRARLTAMHPRRPIAELVGVGERCQWWIPNAAGHRRMLRAAGFDIDRASRPYAIPLGPGHPHRSRPARRALAATAGPFLPGWPGVPHVAALARPRQ